jgi:MtrB/PioB family decaheme-associated outer membrane protein
MMTNAVSRRTDRRPLLFVVFACAYLSAMPLAALAQDDEDTGPDTSRWQCRNCPEITGWLGSLLFGPIYASDDYYEFGNYRGLPDQGFYPGLGVDLLWRDENARYLDVRGNDLGLESRTLNIEGGKQGAYVIGFVYDEIQHYRADDTRTVFLGAGTADQRLPSNWVLAGTTSGMTALDASLVDQNIARERRILGLGLEIVNESPWSYRLGVKQSQQDGSLIKGASFIFRAAELVAPVDYETTHFDAAVAYAQDRFRLEAGYNLSLFDNGNDSLTWENPFIGILGAQLGRMAEPPDNQFHQFMLSGSWRQSRLLTIAGQVAAGRVQQDDAFLQYTVNPNIPNPMLPRADLDGEVDTRIANFRVSSNLTNRLRTRVQFRFDERDNKSPRDAYTQIVSDTFLTGSEVNEPYSYKRRSLDGSVDYRFDWVTISALAKFKEMERTLQEVEDTDTEDLRLRARMRPFPRFNMSVEVGREERNNDLDPALLGPGVNPELRRFHYAEKKRETMRITADYAILDNLVAGFYADIADEEYEDTEIGLSDARSESYGLDISASISQHVSLHAYYARELLNADISGADNNDGARWEAIQRDDYETAGLGMRFDKLPGQWVSASVDVTYAAADGNIQIEKQTVSAPDFPRLDQRRFTLEAAAERQIKERWNLRLAYLVGRLAERDYFRDGVDPATVPLLLSLGEGTPDRTVHVVSAMLRYRFPSAE